MVLHELAEEFALTDDAAAALCARLGIPAGWSGAMLTTDEEARFRAAAHAELTERADNEPPLAASMPRSFPPPSGSPVVDEDAAAGWAAPHPPEVDPAPQTPPGWSAPSAPQTGWSAPSASPDSPNPPTPPAPGFAPGFEPTAPGFGPSGRGAPGPAGFGPGGPGPYGPPPHGGVPSGVNPADWARLDQARAHARSLINQGIACLALGLAITIGTMMIAPGGFFIITFGTVFVGFRRIRAGQAIKAQIRAAERQMRGG